MSTVRLDLAYDGTDFHGYARQPGVRTVQGELEDALAPFVSPLETVVAGRTDRGVHADGQVVSFVTPGPVDLDRICRSLNRRLGPEIAVLGAAFVPDGFHARFSATGRAYRYRILDREAPDPFVARTTLHFPTRLDVDAMDRAMGAFVGEHDFASFCRNREGKVTVREVRWAGWRRVGDIVELSIGASSFCHQMVRSIVALSLEVGRGRVAVDDVPAILAARDRARAKGAAPAHGLTLVGVGYPGEELRPPAWLADR